jgi:hypothetical protein
VQKEEDNVTLGYGTLNSTPESVLKPIQMNKHKNKFSFGVELLMKKTERDNGKEILKGEETKVEDHDSKDFFDTHRASDSCGKPLTGTA